MKENTLEYRNSMKKHIRNRSYCKVVLTLPDATTVTWTDDNAYQNNRLVSVTINEYNSPIAEELPQTDATIILNNRDLYFDPMLETGIAASLVNGLSITISFGYDIKGDGVITWLAPTPLLLDTWQIGEAEVSLTAVDLFQKVVASEKMCVGSISIYDCATIIFGEVGVYSSIDGYVSYLDDPGQDYLILNPVPYTTAGELLQMLANAGHGYLYVDDDGTFHLAKIAAALPDYTVTSTGEHPLSGDYSNILDATVNRKCYTAIAMNFWKADGEAILTPADAANRVSNAVWMTNGIATDLYDTGGEACVIDEFALEITLDAPVSVTKLRIYTGHTRTSNEYGPVDVVVWLYSASDMANPRVLYCTQSVGKDYLSVNVTFNDLIKIKISNVDQNGNNVSRFDEYARFSIASVVLGDQGNLATDVIKRSDMFTAPILSDENRIKSITVECDVPTTDGDFYFSTDVVIPANQVYTFTIEHDAVEGGNGYITTEAANVYMNSSILGGFATRFTVTNESNVAATVHCHRIGTAIKLERKSLTVTYDTQGKELHWYNPLVNFSEAKKMADWIYSFYSGKFDMEFEWRGDPKFQAADMVGVERVDGTTQIGRIVETETSYAGTLRGRMTVRKVVM